MSRTTVSLVLADHPRITEPTKRRVREAMRRIGYVYNRTATAVRSGQSGLVGLLLTDIRNPFFAELTMSVERAVEETGKNAIVGFSLGSTQREYQIALSLAEHLIGGMILLPTPDSTREGLSFLAGPTSPPLVQLLREVPGLPSDYVGVDNVASGRLLGEHLREVGITDAVFVGGDHASAQYEARWEGLSAGLGGNVTRVLGGAAGLTSMAGPLTCVVTYNDSHLLTVLQVLRAQGLEPGRDVALASFDNTPLSSSVHPEVTAVDHYAAQLAELAVDQLAGRAAEPEREWQRTTVAGTLVVRDSTTLRRL